MLAIFVDGPLVGEVKNIPPMPTWTVMLPPRETVCYCDSDFGEVIDEFPRETVTYHVIMHGDDVAMMAISRKPADVATHMKHWLVSNFQADIWSKDCRSERAFL